MQGLCCVDAQGPSAWKLIDNFIAASNENLQTVHTSRKYLRIVWDNSEQCDTLLKRYARKWELSRLALVDRNILRLATYELLKDANSFKIIISEALKLAREFSTSDSPRFINGVLDAIGRELRKSKGLDELPVPEGKTYPKPRTDEEIEQVEKAKQEAIEAAKAQQDQEMLDAEARRKQSYQQARSEMSKGAPAPVEPGFDVRKYDAYLQATSDAEEFETREIHNFSDHADSPRENQTPDNNAGSSEIVVTVQRETQKVEKSLKAAEIAHEEIKKTTDAFIAGRRSLIDSVIGLNLDDSEEDFDDDLDDEFDEELAGGKKKPDFDVYEEASVGKDFEYDDDDFEDLDDLDDLDVEQKDEHWEY